MVVSPHPKSLSNVSTHYCPGCTHGVIHRIIAEVIDELGIEGNTVGVVPVGCSVFGYNYFNIDMQQAAHGRAPAVATGIKRTNPSNIVFTYQGDGDLAAIGMAETVHAAARSENITVIHINNAIYGMTGGQMSPTTLVGQVTQTTPFGRDVATQGMPIDVSKMIATIEGAAYVRRCAANNVKNIREVKKAIKEAFEVQIRGKGFSMVEILSNCPTNWGMSAVDSLKFIEDELIPKFPLGLLKGGEQ